MVLDIREQGRKFRYLFSGDVGRGDDDILRDPEPVENVDYLQVESTYGGREHSPKANANDGEWGGWCARPSTRNGKVIIPSFSVGRTQQIVYTLHQLTDAGQLPQVPIFVDSPLSVNATEIYRLHPECFNETIYKFLREKENPFGMENLTYIRELAHSMKLNDLEGTGDHHQRLGHVRGRAHPAPSLKNHIGDAEQPGAVHRLLRRTHPGRPDSVRPQPRQHLRRTASVRARVGRRWTPSPATRTRTNCGATSRRSPGDIKQICVIHGEESQALAFGETLRAMKPKAQVIVPGIPADRGSLAWAKTPRRQPVQGPPETLVPLPLIEYCTHVAVAGGSARRLRLSKSISSEWVGSKPGPPLE